MNKPTKKRLCWNCEGSVGIDAESCPYCGVSVVPASLDSGGTGTSFMPSYTMGSAPDNTIPRSPYSAKETNEEAEEAPKITSQEDESTAPLDEFQNTLMATILLLTGSVFLLFSLALVLFAHDGVLTLQWDGSLWYLYALLALPLLFLGWRYFSKLDRDR